VTGVVLVLRGGGAPLGARLAGSLLGVLVSLGAGSGRAGVAWVVCWAAALFSLVGSCVLVLSRRCVVSSSLVVGFGGVRGLPSVGAPGGLVSRVVSSVVSAGGRVVVGCCVGADAAVLSSALGLGASPSVFAAFGPGGAGSWRGSAVSLVSAAAERGCPVRFWAGGSASVPLGGRLAARTRALVSSLPAGRSAFVAFFSSSSRSVGTRGACSAAAAAGVPVFAFVVGGGPGGRAGLPRLLVPGSWVPAGGSGVWASAFRFVPAS
jgi:hypothetical protein